MSNAGFRLDTSHYSIDASEFYRTLREHVERGKPITIKPSPDAVSQPEADRIYAEAAGPRKTVELITREVQARLAEREKRLSSLSATSWGPDLGPRTGWRAEVTTPPVLNPTKPLDEAARDFVSKPSAMTREARACQMADDAVAIFGVGGSLTKQEIVEDGLRELKSGIDKLVEQLA